MPTYYSVLLGDEVKLVDKLAWEWANSTGDIIPISLLFREQDYHNQCNHENYDGMADVMVDGDLNDRMRAVPPCLYPGEPWMVFTRQELQHFLDEHAEINIADTYELVR
jgi:hypothetical protein